MNRKRIYVVYAFVYVFFFNVKRHVAKYVNLVLQH